MLRWVSVKLERNRVDSYPRKRDPFVQRLLRLLGARPLHVGEEGTSCKKRGEKKISYNISSNIIATLI